MIDWGIVAKVAGGGFGTTIAVLVILSLVAWIVGLVVQKSQAKAKEDSEKG
ncbi:hypothetical protein ES703_91942 [subsurface metagenome]